MSKHSGVRRHLYTNRWIPYAHVMLWVASGKMTPTSRRGRVEMWDPVLYLTRTDIDYITSMVGYGQGRDR